MAMGFVLAVAADREVALAGEGGEELDGVAVLRRCRLGPVVRWYRCARPPANGCEPSGF
jgi:hypothetical protein